MNAPTPTRVRNLLVLGETSWWLDGLHMGTLLNTFLAFSTALGQNWWHNWGWVWPVLLGLTVLSLLRGWVLLATPFALVAVLAVSRLQLRDLYPAAADDLPYFSPVMGTAAEIVPLAAVLAGAVTLVLLRRRSDALRTLNARSWWWFAAPAVAFCVAHLDLAHPGDFGWTAGVAVVQLSILGIVLVWTAFAHDGRLALAALVFFLPEAVWLWTNGWPPSDLTMTYCACAAGITAGIIAAATRTSVR